MNARHLLKHRFFFVQSVTDFVDAKLRRADQRAIGGDSAVFKKASNFSGAIQEVLVCRLNLLRVCCKNADGRSVDVLHYVARALPHRIHGRL